jgi:copper resistance protein C
MTGGLLRCAVAAALSLLFAVLGPASTGFAHTELANALPAAGTALAKTPGSVQLNFTEPIDAELARVVVLGPEGRDLAVGGARQSGPGLIQPIAAPAQAGTVEVAYRVVSLDGHPVSGTYTFDVLRGDPAAGAPSDGGAPDQGAAGAGGDAAAPAGGSMAGLLLGAGAVLLVVAVGGVLARRRSRTAAPAPQTSPPTP